MLNQLQLLFILYPDFMAYINWCRLNRWNFQGRTQGTLSLTNELECNVPVLQIWISETDMATVITTSWHYDLYLTTLITTSYYQLQLQLSRPNLLLPLTNNLDYDLHQPMRINTSYLQLGLRRIVKGPHWLIPLVAADITTCSSLCRWSQYHLGLRRMFLISSKKGKRKYVYSN